MIAKYFILCALPRERGSKGDPDCRLAADKCLALRNSSFRDRLASRPLTPRGEAINSFDARVERADGRLRLARAFGAVPFIALRDKTAAATNLTARTRARARTGAEPATRPPINLPGALTLGELNEWRHGPASTLNARSGPAR